MTAVTQRIGDYLGGVSKQPDSKKKPGQVKECINGLPDITTGLAKRPGFKFISVLKNLSGTAYSNQLDGAKWFYINRGDGDRYVGCVTPKDSTNGTIKIWNAVTGVACTITDTTTSSALGAHTYLTGAKTNYDILTVHDKTIITNNTVVVTTQPNPTFVAQTRGTLLLLGTDAQMGNETFTATVAGQLATYTSQASDGYDEVLDGLKTDIDSKNISGLTVTKYGTSLQLDRVISGTRTTFTLTAKGGKDNKGIVVFQDWAENASLLPPHSFHDHVVEIINTHENDQDNYYAKFVANNGVNDFGYWKETIGPTASPGLVNSTMPHVLLCTATNTFTFGPESYTERNVGDNITNSHPTIVGKTIQQAFFHANRLGFLTEDNISMSRAGDPFNFYHRSARVQTPDDPIDISATSIKPAILHAVQPTTQGLVLFSKSQQFLMYSESGPMTPSATKIRPISSMEMDANVDPIDIGTHMHFISKTPNYTRVFSFQTRGLQENPAILDIGRVVNEWITIDVDTLVASIQNEFIAMSSQSSDEVFFYRTYSDGEDLLMEAWFKWKLPGLVQTMAVDEDDMFVVTKQGSQYTISSANLTMSPEASVIISNSGQKVNPCLDLYTTASNGLTGGNLRTVTYDPVTDQSKCYIQYANLAVSPINKKPVVVVGGTTAAGTFNNSGFTVTPEVASDSHGTYFLVPGNDFSGIASNVYVGWAYDFDVTLPQLYYALDEDGRQKDFTANLTISRLKFDVGLSGVLGFKLKAIGRLAASKTYTGDGTRTNFNWMSSDLPYIDRNQVKVKVNNVLKTLTTDYTFVSDTEINFQSNKQPANGDKLVIYLDEWYQLSPITSANTYLADDVPLDESTVFTLPVHQRSKNFSLRVFNDSPFPVSLNSMMWEGNYSPRFYKRSV